MRHVDVRPCAHPVRIVQRLASTRVIKELGGSSTVCLLTAGPTGEQLRGLLQKAGLDLLPVEGDGDTRISFRVYEERSAEQYRFVLPGPRQSEGVMERVLDAVGRGLGER